MRHFITAAVIGTALVLSGTAHAGIYKDDLSRCIVAATNAADREKAMRWVFVAMATNPRIKDMAAITPAQMDGLNKDMSLLMQRLLLTDCRDKAVNAVKYEGGDAIAESFRTLGQVAMADLMGGEATVAYLGKLGDHLDKPKWEAFAKEVGNRLPAPPAK